MAKIVNDATGAIIEYPGPINMRSPFPYPGYWSAVYPSMISLLKEHADSLRNTPDAIVKQAFDQAVAMANGEFASILTNRLWEIGELMTLNPLLRVQGRAGTALGFVPETAYGGKDAVAARVFEVPVAALVQQASMNTMAQNSAQAIINEATTHRQKLHNLNLSLAELEASTPTEQTIREKTNDIFALRKQHETTAGEVHEISMRIAHMQEEISAFNTVKSEYNSLMREHDRLVKAVNNANRQMQTANTLANRKRAETNAAKASAELRIVRSRTDNLGVHMSRQAASFGPDLISDMNQLLNIKKRELAAIEKQLKSCETEMQRLTNQRSDGIRSGQAIWAQIKLTSNHIKRSDVSISNAQKNLNGLTEMDANRLVKVWMDHLKGAKEEVVSLLFKDRATAGAGLTNQPLTRVYNNLYDPGTMQDFTDFTSTLTDIGDKFTNEEYDLLEQIGRLGLSMDYVPGTARLMALSDMSKKERLIGYRNLVEEILSQGQKLSADKQVEIMKTGIPGFGPIYLEDDEDLVEVKRLVQHLAESQLNFKYRSGY